MSSKMLIDASHPEETRVVVTKGNKIEDFDFESEHKKQIRGNIYLAKVTRVEPSLQAAFVEYGGNRHGFLPFSEIHPDYYQIPVADREALMREMAEELAAEEADDDASASRAADASSGEDEGGEQTKTRRRSRRGGRRRKSASASGADETESAEEADGTAEAAADKTAEAAADEVTEADEDRSGDDAAGDADDEPDAFADDDDSTASAMVESESISDDPSGGSEAAAEEPAEKPKRRTSRRKKAPVEAESEASEPAPGAGSVADAEEAPKPKRRASRRKKAPVEAGASESTAAPDDAAPATDAEAKPAAEEKPKRRSTRRRKTTDDAVAEETAEALALNEAEGGDAKGGASSDTAKAGDAGAAAPTADDSADETKARTVEDADDPEGDDHEGDDADGDDAEAGDEDAPEETGADDALDEAPRRKPSPRKHYKIQEVIKRRQILLVQVTKEERGNKGAALTTYLSLAGRYSVLMPNTARGGGISRKIANASDRKRLKEIAKGLDVPDGMGVILRTAAAARSKQEVNRDFEYLMRLWDSVRELTLQSTAPALVYEEGNLIKRSIRDLYNKEMGDIIVAGESGYREAKDFMRMLMPSQARMVKRWDKPTSLLAAHGVEAELERMMQPQVNLKSGGYIIINQTEALVAIDVNSGRATREHSVEQTARNTNLEAAEEIARQLRLRDLAGLIVIDFIDMDEKRNNRAVETKLKECLKNDRARIQLGRISSFGLLEMSRQRMRSSVLEATMQECPHCHGTGYLRSESSVALGILRAVEEQMRKHPNHAVTVRTDAATALSVLNGKRAQLAALEAEHGVPVVLEADATLPHQDFKVERGPFVERRERIERQVRQDQSLMDAVDADTDEDEGGLEAAGRDEAEDERGDGKRRRRGRRGGRNRRADERDDERESRAGEREEPASPAEIVEEAVEEGPTEGVTTADAPEGDAPKRRRRSSRGKASETSNGTDEPGDRADADGAEEQPKRRSTRRRKAPAGAEAAADETGDAGVEGSENGTTPSDASGGTEEADAPSEPPRRSTRRRKAPVGSATMAVATTAAELDAATEAASSTQDAASLEDADDERGATATTRRRTRRVTRRIPGAETGAASNGAASTPAPSGDVPTTDTVAANDAAADGDDESGHPASEANGADGSVADDRTADETATDDEGGKRKSKHGWWNRGFF